VICVGFLLLMYCAIAAIVFGLGIDLQQYTPGANGQSPQSGSAGLVKEAIYDLANEPVMFWLAFPSVAFGAPLAEELIFRGAIFSRLLQTPLGKPGTVLVTSFMWAMMHITEPWLSVLLISVMGLALGWLLLRFGSLWVTIICHGLWNGIFSVMVLGFSPQ
jgi:membrane protease YdiL (CAAX protease family)